MDHGTDRSIMRQTIGAGTLGVPVGAFVWLECQWGGGVGGTVGFRIGGRGREYHGVRRAGCAVLNAIFQRADRETSDTGCRR